MRDFFFRFKDIFLHIFAWYVFALSPTFTSLTWSCQQVFPPSSLPETELTLRGDSLKSKNLIFNKGTWTCFQAHSDDRWTVVDLTARPCIKKIVLHSHLFILQKSYINSLGSNPHYKADAKEFVVIMKIFIICYIKCLNLDKMTAGYLVFQNNFSSQRWK